MDGAASPGVCDVECALLRATEYLSRAERVSGLHFASSAIRRIRTRIPFPETALATQTRGEKKGLAGLSRDQLVAAYRTMLLSRRLDDKEIQLKRQNKIFFQISGAGHEAVLTAAGLVLRPAYDWFFPYYRDRALCLELGMTPAEMLYEAVGAAIDPNSGGRQMPSHWGTRRSTSCPRRRRPGRNSCRPSAPPRRRCARSCSASPTASSDDEVVLVSTGDGTTSEGEFWESLNTASNLKLPIVYLVEDNGYAISVPVEVNTAGGSISKLVRSFPDLPSRKSTAATSSRATTAMRSARRVRAVDERVRRSFTRT